MSWRIIQVSSVSKLDCKLNYLVVRNDKITKIHLSEISVLILESTAISLTAALLNELIKRKIKVIFCDELHNPSSELVPLYGSHDTSYKIRCQIKWDDVYKKELWTEIVKEKIKNQKTLLEKLGKIEYKLLEKYIEEIYLNDETNREGHAAKVYFNSLFGKDFSRSQPISINSALNYGYMVLLSAISREISANGYLTTLGIFHNNMFNNFNLSCDLIEPLRPLVDNHINNIKPEKFEKEEKLKVLDILNIKVKVDNQEHFLNNAIKIYIKSILDSIEEKDLSKIKYIEYEF